MGSKGGDDAGCYRYPKMVPHAEQSYKKDYSEGYEEAEEEFKVLATCSKCGTAHLPVAGDKMKEAAGQALKGWFSPACQHASAKGL